MDRFPSAGFPIPTSLASRCLNHPFFSLLVFPVNFKDEAAGSSGKQEKI
jgi:hypothetical protein